MREEQRIPSPGSPEAQAQGCSCQPRDFDESENSAFPGWLTVGCPLHGSTAAQRGIALVTH